MVSCSPNVIPWYQVFLRILWWPVVWVSVHQNHIHSSFSLLIKSGWRATQHPIRGQIWSPFTYTKWPRDKELCHMHVWLLTVAAEWLPWAGCRGICRAHQCTGKLSHHVSCSHSRTERLRTSSSTRRSHLKHNTQQCHWLHNYRVTLSYSPVFSTGY